MFVQIISHVLLLTLLTSSSMSICSPYDVTFYNTDASSSLTNKCETQDFTPAILMGNLYYYNQLDDVEKRLYNDLINSTNKFLNGDNITLTLCTYDQENKRSYPDYFYFVKRVIKAYTYDNPEAVVWFENYNRTYYIAESKDYVYMKLTPKTTTESTSSLNAINIKTELTELQSKVKNFVGTLTGTDAEKIKQINNWLIENVSYDKSISFPDRDNIYGPIMKGTAICSGYSYAFKYIADLAGLNVIYVTGKAYDVVSKSFMPHAWNFACVDGVWLLVDVTSGSKSGTKYLLSNPNNNIHFMDNSYEFTYPV